MLGCLIAGRRPIGGRGNPIVGRDRPTDGRRGNALGSGIDDCAAATAGNPINTIAANTRRIALPEHYSPERFTLWLALPHELPRDLVGGKSGRVFRKHARMRGHLEIVGIAKELGLAERPTEK
jgi:hypothetical protein